MKISIMWMTRKRSHELIYSLSSFIMRAKDNSNVEYIVISDPDDDETYEAIEKINRMCFVDDVEIKNLVSDKRYGYEELEQYQNIVGEVFTGDCLFIMNDDVVCLNDDWDDEIRNSLKPHVENARWIGLAGVNENWKGSTTFVGINRKWYEVTNRVSGNRATDGYIMTLGKKLGIEPLRPKVEMVHLQRGRETVTFERNNKRYITGGLPDDGLGGYPTKSPKPPKYYHDPNEFTNDYTDFVEGKKRFDNDFKKLKEHYAE